RQRARKLGQLHPMRKCDKHIFRDCWQLPLVAARHRDALDTANGWYLLWRKWIPSASEQTTLPHRLEMFSEHFHLRCNVHVARGLLCAHNRLSFGRLGGGWLRLPFLPV